MYLNSYVRHHPRLRGVRVMSYDDLPNGTYTPPQIASGYGISLGAYKPNKTVKIGVLSLGGSYDAANLNTACSALGIAMPSVDAIVAGGASQNPADKDSNVENDLDLQCISGTWYQATKTAANLVIAFGENASGGMLAAFKALLAAGCAVISISWGGPRSQWADSEVADLESEFEFAIANGVTIIAAAGDNSVDDGTGSPITDFPSCSKFVWAVGGTFIKLSSSFQYVSEKAWGDGNPGDEGGGGGYDPTVPTPPWQVGVLPAGSTGRGSPDTSANADPNSGYRIWTDGSPTVVGGTSGAAPTTAALVAVAKACLWQEDGFLLPMLYTNRETACRPVTQGSNGDPAGPGWNPATGNGSPNGGLFLAALAGQAAPAPPTPIAPPMQPAPKPQAPTDDGDVSIGDDSGDPGDGDVAGFPFVKKS